MSQGIRWIPAKSKGLGQSAPAPASESSNEKAESVMNNIVYGGLILAGLAFLWAVTMKATPEND